MVLLRQRLIFYKMGFTVLLVLMIILLTACDRPPVVSNLASETIGYPKTIITALGKAEIDQSPRRIVALGSGSEDILLALGIVPIAIESHYWGGDRQGYLPWFKEEIERRGARLPVIIEMYPELDIEKIIKLKPDLILATQSGITQADFNALSYFAPVVAYPDKPWQTTPQQQIKLIANELDKQPQGKKLSVELDAMLVAAGHRIPNIQNYQFAYIKAGTTANSLSIYVKNDPRVDTLVHIGLSLLPLAKTVTAPFGSFAVNIGLENADLLNDADILLTWYNSEKERQQTESQPLFQSIRAVRQGVYIPLTDQALVMSMSYGSPLSLRWGLPKFMSLLQQELAKHDKS